MTRPAWSGSILLTVLGVTTALPLSVPEAQAWDDGYHDDVCYLRDHHDAYGDLVEVSCDSFCDGGCTKTARDWCRELSYGADWPIPSWAYESRCGESILDLLCSTEKDRFHVLVRQYLAGALDARNGACLPDLVHDAGWDAHEVLRGCRITSGERAEADRLVKILGAYDKGAIGPGSCDHDDCDDESSEDGPYDRYDGDDDDSCDDDGSSDD